VSAAPAPPHRLAAWARRPALAIGLLGVAVAVSVAHGQPPPVDRPSGVSVTVGAVDEEPPRIGHVLLVTGGRVVRFDTYTRHRVPLPLPRGVLAQQVWSVTGSVVVLGRLPDHPAGRLPDEDRPTQVRATPERTAAYLVRPSRPAHLLGPAERVLPAAGGHAVWLASGALATRVRLPAGERQLVVRLPPTARLVGDTPAGLVATTGSALTETPANTARPGDRTATVGGRAGGAVQDRAGTPAPRTTSPPEGAGGQADWDSGADAVPLTTLLVQSNGLTRYIAEAEALAAAGDIVLVQRADLRLGVVRLDGTRPVRWLPKLSAVEVTGPAALDFHGRTFAVLARVNDHVRLMIGPITADSEADINVVALEGGMPTAPPAPPAFTVAGWVLAPRPDGKVVYYFAGERAGRLLGNDLPPTVAVAQG
jgi:hypothetical protein